MILLGLAWLGAWMAWAPSSISLISTSSLSLHGDSQSPLLSRFDKGSLNTDEFFDDELLEGRCTCPCVSTWLSFIFFADILALSLSCIEFNCILHRVETVKKRRGEKRIERKRTEEKRTEEKSEEKKRGEEWRKEERRRVKKRREEKSEEEERGVKKRKEEKRRKEKEDGCRIQQSKFFWLRGTLKEMRW